MFRQLNRVFKGLISASENIKAVREKQEPEISLLFPISEDTEAGFTKSKENSLTGTYYVVSLLAVLYAL